jgi:hypothetical protein
VIFANIFQKVKTKSIKIKIILKKTKPRTINKKVSMKPQRVIKLLDKHNY